MTSAIVPIFLFSILNTFFFTSSLLAQNAVEPGQFIVEPPTLTNLGFEWYLTGDANRNATVQEKKPGDTQEKENSGQMRQDGGYFHYCTCWSSRSKSIKKRALSDNPLR